MNIVSNLSGFILMPYQLIIDIASQFKLDAKEVANKALRQICKLETISDWVDLDSYGDPVALKAYELSLFLSDHINKRKNTNLNIDIYLDSSGLTIDNCYSLMCLLDMIPKKISLAFYLTETNLVHLKQFIPNFHKAVNIFFENKPQKDAEFLTKIEHLKLSRYQLIKSFGYDFFDADSEKIKTSTFDFGSPLIAYMWRCLKSGGYELGMRVTEKLINDTSLSYAQKEAILVNRQHIAFLSHQHEFVVNQIYPRNFEFQEEWIVKNLYFIKAFSATLLKDFELARDCFSMADISLNMSIVDENAIYQLNLLALFFLLQNDIDSAFLIEKHLNRYLIDNKIKTTAINYVILINLARLYKKNQDRQKALIFYEKAYQKIREGGFTLFDSMYYNMDKAGIFEYDTDISKALTCWIKVALYWLSSDNPYALALKPRVVLCQEKAHETLLPLNKEKVNQFLVSKISFLATKLGYSLEKVSKTFIFISNKLAVKKETCFFAEDIMFYGCHIDKTLAQQKQNIEKKLSDVLSTVIDQHFNFEIEENAIIIEQNYENFDNHSWKNLLSIAVMQGCRFYCHENKKQYLDPKKIAKILNQIYICLSAMVSSWSLNEDNVELIYKRSFLNSVVNSPLELELIRKLLLNEKICFQNLTVIEKGYIIEYFSRQIVQIKQECSLVLEKTT